MVDPIEVKLDEMDAKIDQIAYAPKYKATYEIGELLKSRATGGFLDTIMRGLTGKGALGGIAGGIAAGGAAGGLLVLADAIAGLTKQSKILGDVQANLTKSISLLVDLVLMPFLPLIYGGIIALYSGIVGFGGWWKEVWDTMKKEGLVGMVKLGLSWAYDTLADWLVNLTEWLFSDKPITTKIAEIGLAILDFIGDMHIPGLPGMTIKKILSWIFGDSKETLQAITTSLIVNLIEGGMKFISRVLDYIFGEGGIGRNTLDFTINLIRGAGDWLWNLIEGIYNVGAESLNKISGGTINLPVSAGTSSTTSNRTNNGGNLTQNFYGLQPEGLDQQIKDALRQFSGGWLNL